MVTYIYVYTCAHTYECQEAFPTYIYTHTHTHTHIYNL